MFSGSRAMAAEFSRVSAQNMWNASITRARQRRHLPEGMKAAMRGDVLFLKQTADLLDALVEAVAAFIHRDAEAGELVRQEGAREANLDAALGDRIDHADLAGKLQRIVKHRKHRTGDQPHLTRDRGRRAQENQWIGAIAAVRVEIVFDRPHVGVAELLGELREL